MNEIQIRFISANATPDMTQPGIVEVTNDDLAGRTFQISDQGDQLNIVPLMVVNRDLGDETADPLSPHDIDKIAGLLWTPEVKEKVIADMGPGVVHRFLGYALTRRRQAAERIAKTAQPSVSAFQPG